MHRDTYPYSHPDADTDSATVTHPNTNPHPDTNSYLNTDPNTQSDLVLVPLDEFLRHADGRHTTHRCH